MTSPPCPLTLKVIPLLDQCGLSGTLLFEDCRPQHYGIGASVFRAGRLLFRFSRDYYSDYLEIAVDSNWPEFWQWADIQVAMGWDSLDDVLSQNDARGGPEPIEVILPRVQAHRLALENALIDGRDRFVRAALERATRRGLLPGSGNA